MMSKQRFRNRRRITWLALALLVGVQTALAGQPPASQPAPEPEGESAESVVPPPPAGPPPRPWRIFGLDGPYASGNWGGGRDALAEAGFRFSFYYTQYYQKALRGGRELNDNIRGSGTIDAIFDLDLDKMGLVPGGQLFAHARRQWGAGINPITGTLQQVNDDADGDRTLHLDQLWYAQRIGQELTLRLGFLDFQTIIDRNRFANSEDIQFWNAALDNTPSIPWVAQSGLGVAAIWRPTKWYTLILGAVDADTVLYKPGFSTTFHDAARFNAVMEHTFTVQLPSANGPLEGNYRVGGTYWAAEKALIDKRFDRERGPDMEAADYGVHASFDQMLYRENAESQQGLGAFFRYGYRPARTNRSSIFWSAGLQYEGLIPKRDEDVLGFGVAQLMASPRYTHFVKEDNDDETIYELYYRLQLTDWLAITPDMQYITGPGGDRDNDDVVTVGIRTRLSF
jgi:porin